LVIWKRVSVLGFLVGYLNILHPFRHRLDNLILLAGRALFALVILTVEEQDLFVVGPKLEGLLLLSFHQLEELQLSHSFVPNSLEPLAIEVHAQVIKVKLVACSRSLEPVLLLRGYCYVPRTLHFLRLLNIAGCQLLPLMPFLL
jgi:hypothetical protein